MEQRPTGPQDEAVRALSRRNALRGAFVLGAALAAPSIPVFTAAAQAAPNAAADGNAAAGARGGHRPAALIPDDRATALTYPAPAVEAQIMQQGLPVGNGRLGAMTTGDPADEAFYLTDASLWTGNANATLGSDGQFPYDTDDFGTFGLLAQAYLAVPAHTAGAISGYQRRLDLSNGLAVVGYRFGGVSYRREVWSSHPDDLVVVRLSQSGGGSWTGSLTLDGTRGETVRTDGADAVAFTAALPNGLGYAVVARVAAVGGRVIVTGNSVGFSGCQEVVLLLSGGTNYAPTAATGYLDPAADPLVIARGKAAAAAASGGAVLLGNHLADYQPLQQAMTLDLGRSSAAQRALDTADRLTARAAAGSPPDPELEASYLQFGRYLMITGSRTGLPVNLQGIWAANNTPPWMGDYHTDINVEMNYWLPDRTGLPGCFDAFADYCVNQFPGWESSTQALFNDPGNGFRNTSGKIAGWTVGISTNIWGGSGWWWHPAGNAWLCSALFQHYEYTLDRAYLARIYPLLKGACEFWEARLITTTVTDPVSGAAVQVLVDDHDWSPEQGPTDAIGITYAQELVWQLFGYYQQAAAALRKDAGYAATIGGLQDRLYLPRVSDTTGMLEEWMTDADLGDPAHRHLSPLIGLFPGDRIDPSTSPAALVDGATALLTARGMESYGWGLAWRAACWARLGQPDNAYQLFLNVLTPSVNGSNGASENMFDMYSQGTSAVFQIDANFGTPSAMVEMLVHSRPGLVALLPALPSAWAASGSATGIGVRGGFTLDLAWSDGQVTEAVLHSVGGTTTTVQAGLWSKQVTVPAGGRVTLHPTGSYRLVNRRSGLVLAVAGSATAPGAALVQSPATGAGTGAAAQRWRFRSAPGGSWTLVNVNSGLLVDVAGGGTAPGAAVDQWSDASSTNQQWQLEDVDGGWVKLVCVRSGLVLGVAGDSGTAGAGVQQQRDTGDHSQQWRLKGA